MAERRVYSLQLRAIQWRNDIFRRNNWTCQKYNERGIKLNAHHIIPFSELIKKYNIKTILQAINCSELWNLDNGITFSEKAHKEFHRRYGIKNNTLEQVLEFMR